jgi:hypothetical protein
MAMKHFNKELCDCHFEAHKNKYSISTAGHRALYKENQLFCPCYVFAGRRKVKSSSECSADDRGPLRYCES